ncbi:MAG: hypothetical protein ACE5HJ_07820 [Thermoplasmata archaeon]
MTKDEGFVLTKGSKYKVVSAATRDKPMETVGTFKGFTSIGPDEALVMELDESHGEASGSVRLVPLHMVLAIDVLEAVEEEEKEREPEKMFG